MTLVFIDTETTGLDPDRHSVWEIAYAGSSGPILSSFVAHSTEHADPTALALNGYLDRFVGAPLLGLAFEKQLREDIEGATIVAANPAFDAAFLRTRWGVAPWHHRMLDIESYAAAMLGMTVPLRGLKGITDELRRRGFTIPEPDHTAAGDVATLRTSFTALLGISATPVSS